MSPYTFRTLATDDAAIAAYRELLGVTNGEPALSGGMVHPNEAGYDQLYDDLLGPGREAAASLGAGAASGTAA